MGLSVRLLGDGNNPGLCLLFLELGKEDAAVEIFAPKAKPGLAI
jgi:hypothetical protein